MKKTPSIRSNNSETLLGRSQSNNEKLQPFNAHDAIKSISSLLMVDNIQTFKKIVPSIAILNKRYLELSEKDLRLVYNDSSFQKKLISATATRNLSQLTDEIRNLAIIKNIIYVRIKLKESIDAKQFELLKSKRQKELILLSKNANSLRQINSGIWNKNSSSTLTNHLFVDHSIDGEVFVGVRHKVNPNNLNEFFGISDIYNYLTSQIVTAVNFQYGILQPDQDQFDRAQDLELALSELSQNIISEYDKDFIGIFASPSSCNADTKLKLDIISIRSKDNTGVDLKEITYKFYILLRAYSCLFPFHSSIDFKNNYYNVNNNNLTNEQSNLICKIEEQANLLSSYISEKIIKNILNNFPNLEDLNQEIIKQLIIDKFKGEIQEIKSIHSEMLFNLNQLEKAFNLNVQSDFTFCGIQVKTSVFGAQESLRNYTDVPVIIGQSADNINSMYQDSYQSGSEARLYKESLRKAIINLI